MSDSPLASCLMRTYNRAPENLWLVEEAIESFLRQDYRNKELIVVNDTPGQVLELDQPYKGVVLVNLPARCRTLGEKFNVCAALAKGDVLFPWDDDDIYLPWRIRLSIQKMGEADYWKPRHCWWNHVPNLKPMGPCFGAAAFKRSAFEKVQGYPFIGVGEDQGIEKAIHAAGLRIETGRIAQDEAFYMYRWGTGSIHVSGYGDTGYDQCGKLPVKTGTFTIRPRWLRDHRAAVELQLLKDKLVTSS